MRVWLCSVLGLLLWLGAEAGHQKVRLTDVKTLTLQRGLMTSGRRAPAVPQLSCVYGGTVDCSQIYLPTVQCYNRGSDGVDVQWECKADMDANYKFGHVQVTCEGFDYPDDPFVLAGSCGLEFYINYAPDKQHQHGGPRDKGGGMGRGWILVLGGGIVVYAIYRTCIAGGGRGVVGGADGRSRSNDDFPDDHGRRPPPPGFRSDYFSSDPSCGTNTFGSSSSTNRGSGLGGFWTGAATGGLLGYMFGARNGGGVSGGGYTNAGGGYTNAGGGGWFGGGTRREGSFGDPQPSTSSGFTRTTSGFGGTRRR